MLMSTYSELLPGKTDSLVEYNNRLIVALCDYIKRHGFFQCFEGHIVFLAYDSPAFGSGDLLVEGPPIEVYPPELLNDLLDRCTYWRNNYGWAMKWLAGLAVPVVIALLIAIDALWTWITS